MPQEVNATATVQAASVSGPTNPDQLCLYRKELDARRAAAMQFGVAYGIFR